MKKLRTKQVVFLSILTLIIISISIATIIYIRNKQKNNEQSSTLGKEYDLEEVYKAFIEEEEYIPEEHTDDEKILENNEMSLSAWIAYWDFTGALNTYKNNTDAIKSLSPTWYYLKASGTLGLKNTARNGELINLCKQNGTKLIPSISNPNASELSAVLNNSSLLNTHIDAIVNEANTYGYDGIDIDYEQIKADDRNQFSQFIKLLAEQLHKHGKVLTIAILWKDDLAPIIEDFSESRAAQDWEEIGKHVDEFRIMAYDYTHSYEQAGPIAPAEWIRSILDYAISNVPIYKIVLGLPFYAYEWTDGTKGAKALVWQDVENIRNNSLFTIINDTIDPEKLEGHLTYKIGNTTKIIWYQDSEVTRNRIELAQTYGVNKFVFWRLGGEDPETFKDI